MLLLLCLMAGRNGSTMFAQDTHGADQPGAERGGDPTAGKAVAAGYPSADLKPFALPPDDTSAGVTDVSFLNHKPAGVLGPVSAGGDGDLYFGREPARFFGFNLCFDACVPERPVAEYTARRLAKFGANVVRFHHFDNPFGLLRDQTTTRKIDPAALDRFDYFIAELKKQGIYTNLNLLVTRRLKPGDGIGAEIDQVSGRADMLLAMWHEPAWDLHAEYARALLGHRNPYTGLTYAEDPAVAFVEILNENGLANSWLDPKLKPALHELPEVYAAPLRRDWQEFVRRQYGNMDKAIAAWGLDPGDALLAGSAAPGLVPHDHPKAAQNSALRRDWLEYLRQVEGRYYRRMRQLIKEELGCRALITSSTAASTWLTLAAEQDVVDGHVYWDNPRWRGATWDYQSRNWHIWNDSQIGTSPGGRFRWLSFYQVAGKPYSVTEFNVSAPNLHAGEAPLFLAMHGAIQGWDALYLFNYDKGKGSANTQLNGLSCIGHPTVMANCVAAAVMFRRGDLKPAVAAATVTMSPQEELVWATQRGSSWNIANGYHGGLSPDRYFHERMQVAITPPSPDRPPRPAAAADKTASPPHKVVTDTGQMTWDATDAKAVFLHFASDRSASAIGAIPGRSLSLGPLHVDIKPTSTRTACTSLVTLDGTGWQDATRMLLIATGRAENTGMRWRMVEIKGRTGWELDDWGRAPTVIEPVHLECRLTSPRGALAVYALDGRGQRIQALSVTRNGDALTFDTTSDPATLWYELVWTR